MHADWIKIVKWLAASNQSVLFQHSKAMLIFFTSVRGEIIDYNWFNWWRYLKRTKRFYGFDLRIRTFWKSLRLTNRADVSARFNRLLPTIVQPSWRSTHNYFYHAWCLIISNRMGQWLWHRWLSCHLWFQAPVKINYYPTIHSLLIVGI